MLKINTCSEKVFTACDRGERASSSFYIRILFQVFRDLSKPSQSFSNQIKNDLLNKICFL